MKHMKKPSVLLPILFFTLIFVLSGCVFYQRYPMAKGRLTKINSEPLTFYLLDASRPHSRVWYISEADFQNDSMRGFLIRLNESEAQEVATVNGNRDARSSKNEVLMYAAPRYALTLADTALVTIRYDQIEKIEVYEVNHNKSLALSLLALLMPILFLGAISVG
ncbi:MAG: hypothetical protein DYG98_05515 [Haliscomenobacteraceae bacterium CHB4]|nr:hypothetical protein [Saprospiraceae bacterium]MCE7922490.1 hypothetical protein [Haliscomenobacteraceae bacterium CHB4]